MRHHDKTSMGGPNEGFETTHWTEIIRAKTDDEARRRKIMGEILGKYWKPVYCFLRRKGYGNEEAKDLVQGFFHEVVLGRDLVQHVDRGKGRFRTFLLTALNRYVTSRHRAETAKKRLPEKGLIHLDGLDSPNVLEPACHGTPDDAFHYAWASALLDQVLSEVRDGCCACGKEAHWAVFCAKIVKPIMEEAEAPSLAELCATHRIANEATASNMIITVKRRFQAALERRVRQFVDSDAEVEDEIRDLMQILSRSSAIS